MPPYSHVQKLNNCKQADLELLALSFQTVYVCKGFYSLANGLIKGYLLTYITFKVMAFNNMKKLEY